MPLAARGAILETVRAVAITFRPWAWAERARASPRPPVEQPVMRIVFWGGMVGGLKDKWGERKGEGVVIKLSKLSLLKLDLRV